MVSGFYKEVDGIVINYNNKSKTYSVNIGYAIPLEFYDYELEIWKDQ